VRGGIRHHRRYLQHSTRVHHLNYRLHLQSSLTNPNMNPTSTPNHHLNPDLSHLPNSGSLGLQPTFLQHFHPLGVHHRTSLTPHLNDEHHRGQSLG